MHITLQKSIFSTLAFSTLTYASITGTVYTDFNLNGVKDSNDIILKNIPITAVCENGQTYNAVTNSNGYYTLSGFPSGEYCRIEADPSGQDLDSSSNSAGSAPLVERIADGTTNHNISVASSGTYCQENPDVVAVAVPAIVDNGSNTYSPTGYATLIKTSQPSEGTNNGQDTIDSTRELLTTFTQTGATWGLAYKKDTKHTFMAASLKPYALLGMGGIGAIYKVTDDGTMSTFSIVPSVSSSALDTYLTSRDVDFDDSDVYQYIAREGLGDIEMSEDYQTLYALNIYQRSLIEMNANTGTIIKTTLLPNPYGSSCPSTDVRPWALTVKGEDVYIGSVCESKISNSDGGLGASIQKYNGSIVQEIARTNTLDYLKPYYQNPTREANGNFNHKSWYENKTSPILTDISFSNTNDLVLSYTNRLSFMRQGNSKLRILGGDIRKMCLNANGTYTDESTAEAPTTCNSTEITYTNNSEKYYEFYVGDFYPTLYGETGHPEIVSGALVQEPGKPYITLSVVDGTDYEGPGAIAQFSHVSGEKIGVQALLKSVANDAAEAEVFGRKAGGLGDIELMCDPAPIEVGNYVWIDFNQNGIQDPDEIPIAGVDVTLWDGNTQIATTTTDNTGHYYFGGIDNASLIKSHHNYTVKIAKSQPQITTATTANPNDPADDVRDNDAQDTGASLEIAFQTTANNDHTLDFGILPVKIGNRVWIEDDKDGDASTGTITPVAGTIVTATCNGVDYTDVTDTNGLYEILVPTDVTCTVKTNTPCNIMPEIYSNDTTVTDTTSENDKSHDASGTTVSVGKIDNMTLDFGCTEAPEVFDLALIKELKVNKTYVPGENVTFTLTVYNQGTLNATNIQISDYIPAGLELNDARWSRRGNTAKLITPIAAIAAGRSTTVDITFTIDANYNGTSITNNAEIRSASGGTDVDSTPDSEYGRIPDPQDNNINNTTGGDDYDPAVIIVGPTPTPTPSATTAPTKPSHVATSSVTANTALLTWSDNSTNESGYKIYQNGTLIATVVANSTSYLVKNLTPNTSYTYTIKAFNSKGESNATTITFSTEDDYAWLPAVYNVILN